MDQDKSIKNFSRAELEFQYSPSRWSKRYSQDAVIGAHVAFSKSASEKVRKSIAYETMRYGKGDKQLIDIYGTSLPKNSPVVVFIHGGYWQEGDKSYYAFMAEPLVKNNIKCATVGYDLVPSVTMSGLMGEMIDLITYLISWADTNKIRNMWMVGHSAGAHISAWILKHISENRKLKEENPIRGFLFVSGIYDLVPLVSTYVNEALQMSKDEAESLSIRKIDLNGLEDVSLIVAVGQYESDEFRRQSKGFYEQLKNGSARAEYLLVDEKDHFDIIEKLEDPNYVLTHKIINSLRVNNNMPK